MDKKTILLLVFILFVLAFSMLKEGPYSVCTKTASQLGEKHA